MKQLTNHDHLVGQAILKTMAGCGMTLEDFDHYRAMVTAPKVSAAMSAMPEARDLSPRGEAKLVQRLSKRLCPVSNLSRECRARIQREERRGSIPAPLSEAETRERAAANAQIERLERIRL